MVDDRRGQSWLGGFFKLCVETLRQSSGGRVCELHFFRVEPAENVFVNSGDHRKLPVFAFDIARFADIFERGGRDRDRAVAVAVRIIWDSVSNLSRALPQTPKTFFVLQSKERFDADSGNHRHFVAETLVESVVMLAHPAVQICRVVQNLLQIDLFVLG